MVRHNGAFRPRFAACGGFPLAISRAVFVMTVAVRMAAAAGAMLRPGETLGTDLCADYKVVEGKGVQGPLILAKHENVTIEQCCSLCTGNAQCVAWTVHSGSFSTSQEKRDATGGGRGGIACRDM